MQTILMGTDALYFHQGLGILLAFQSSGSKRSRTGVGLAEDMRLAFASSSRDLRDANVYVKDYCSHNYPQSSGSYNLATLMGHSDIVSLWPIRVARL
jgi:hypothetical protein